MAAAKSALVFPAWFLAEFMRPCRCSGCGRQAATRDVLAPELRRMGQTVELTYPTRCPCGAACDTIRITMPVLLFGFAMAWFELPKIARRRAHVCGIERIRARESTHAPLLHRNFERSLAALRASAVTPLSEVDRQQLGMDEGEWAAFMRRIERGDNQAGAQ